MKFETISLINDLTLVFLTYISDLWFFNINDYHLYLNFLYLEFLLNFNLTYSFLNNLTLANGKNIINKSFILSMNENSNESWSNKNNSEKSKGKKKKIKKNPSSELRKLYGEDLQTINIPEPENVESDILTESKLSESEANKKILRDKIRKNNEIEKNKENKDKPMWNMDYEKEKELKEIFKENNNRYLEKKKFSQWDDILDTSSSESSSIEKNESFKNYLKKDKPMGNTDYEEIQEIKNNIKEYESESDKVFKEKYSKYMKELIDDTSINKNKIEEIEKICDNLNTTKPKIETNKLKKANNWFINAQKENTLRYWKYIRYSKLFWYIGNLLWFLWLFFIINHWLRVFNSYYPIRLLTNYLIKYLELIEYIKKYEFIYYFNNNQLGPYSWDMVEKKYIKMIPNPVTRKILKDSFFWIATIGFIFLTLNILAVF